MFCPNCGNKLEKEQQVCLSCGTIINANNNTNNNQSQYQNNSNQKSKIAAGLLALFLGTLGVHNFYLGYTGKAVAQLILTLTLCGSIVSGIWAFIEAIMILTGKINVDANGVPLAD